jgi:hypothetical protein
VHLVADLAPKGVTGSGAFRSRRCTIGLVGFEPTASTSRTWRSSQAEPQPVEKKRRLDRRDHEVNRRLLHFTTEQTSPHLPL